MRDESGESKIAENASEARPEMKGVSSRETAVAATSKKKQPHRGRHQTILGLGLRRS